MCRRTRTLCLTFFTIFVSVLACSKKQDSTISGVSDIAGTYYVDCSTGSDSYEGQSKNRAWLTLGRAGQVQLLPGDKLLLRRGCTFDEPLEASWQGTASAPIVVGTYGEGERPKLTRPGPEGAVVHITGKYQIFKNLDISAAAYPPPDSLPNCPTGWRVGFSLSSATNITIKHSRVSNTTAGIFVDAESSRNVFRRNDLVDNSYLSVNTPGDDDDSGAFGILINGDHNIVSRNTFSGNTSFCSYDYEWDGASIEIFEGSNNLIYHNYSSDVTFAELGGTSEHVAHRNTFAYNLHVSTKRKSGEFLIVRGKGGAFSSTHQTHAFNNTVYIAGEQSSGVVCMYCSKEVLALKNNILWVEGTAIYADAAFEETNNLIWSYNHAPHLNLKGFDLSDSSMIADPRFQDHPENDFSLAPNSPAIDAGVRGALHEALAVDFAENPISENEGVDIGAFEFGRSGN